jgi:outer membrane protein assembly factor BamB
MRPWQISVGVPAVAAVCAAATAGLWLHFSSPVRLAPREEFSGTRVPTWRSEYARPSEPSDADAGPPGELTVSDGEPADAEGDWPQFLGPHRNARLADTAPLAESWPDGGPRVLWSKRLGPGHAGAAVWNGRVYVMDYDVDRGGDSLRCLSLDDGREIWNRWYPVRLADDHGISRTVPAVADGYVVTFGPDCHVMCCDARTGGYKWGMDLKRRYGTERPEWYASQCPLIDGDRAVFATGGRALLIAVALEPGEGGEPRILWETPNPGEGPRAMHITHSSITAMSFAGRRMYVYNTTRGTVGVSADGELLWQYSAWRPAINCAAPVDLGGGRILLTADIGTRILRLRETPEGGVSAEEELRLRASDFSSYQQTPVFYGGHLYAVLSQKAGPTKNQLACLTPDGRQAWTSGRETTFHWGSLLAADGKLFVLDDDGTLALAEATADGHRELDRAKVLDGPDAWAPMALVDGRLLLRDVNRMVCLDVASE